MNRRTYLSSLTVGLGLGYSIQNKNGNSAYAKINQFNLNTNEDDVIELYSNSDVENIILDISKFDIKLNNILHTNEPINVKFESKLTNESEWSLLDEYNIDIDSSNMDLSENINNILFSENVVNKLNEKEDSIELDFKILINHIDINELKYMTDFKLKLIITSINISSSADEIYYDSNDIVHKFTSDGELNVDNDSDVEILLVGGGGGGGNKEGRSNQGDAGGGGAGEYFYDENITIPDGSYDVNIGKGGEPGLNGTSSEIDSLIEAIGGGAGAGKSDSPAQDGGSGGGGSSRSGSSGSATGDYEGNSGGIGDDGNTNGGGGGGAGESGSPNPDGSHGGDGLSNDIEERNNPKYYAGGGAGARDESPDPDGGLGGGGGEEEPGVDALGGGGGGGNNVAGSKGGDGVVIIRYESDLPDDSVYKNGDAENIWIQGQSENTGNLEKQDSELYSSGGGDFSGGAYASWVLDKRINLTEYSKIEFNWDYEYSRTNNAFGFYVTDSIEKSRDEQIAGREWRVDENPPEPTVEIDISDINDKYYITFYARDGDSGNSAKAEMWVSEINLIK